MNNNKFSIPTSILFSPHISASGKLIYTLIYNNLDKNGNCYLDNEAFCDILGREVRTVQRELNKMEDMGLISKHHEFSFDDKSTIRVLKITTQTP